MSNIIKLAPYAYLAKRNGSNMHDLLLLVPVDTSGDTDLSNVSPTKSGTRVSINYATNRNSANAPYRVRHFEIDSEGGDYEDIKIIGDNDEERSIIFNFEDADTEPATVSNQKQSCVPYVFVFEEEVEGEHTVFPSCIVLFDNEIGISSESVSVEEDNCTVTFSISDSGSLLTDSNDFEINQKESVAKMVEEKDMNVEVIINANTYLGKPPRKGKVKVIWP